MSGPSFSNIDLWLFELEEGNLSSAQVQQLELFLMLHPEFDVDKDVWNMAKVHPNEMIFPTSGSLVKKRDFGGFYIASVVSIFLLFFSFSPSVTDSFIGNQSKLSINESQSSLLKNLLMKEVKGIRDFEKDKTQPSSGDKTIEVENKSNDVVLLSENNGMISTDYRNINEQRKTKPQESINDVIRVESVRTNTVKDKSFDVYLNENISNTEESRGAYSFNEDGLSALSDLKLISSSYKKKKALHSNSFRKSLRKLSRKIERMANNPVALKNYRDPDFHVPGLLINDVIFSSTGTMLSTRFQTLSRIQWLGEKNEQLMNVIALDGYSSIMKGGIGVQLSHATYGNGGLNVSNVAVTYSPKLSLTKTVTFEPSVRFKMGKKTLNYQRMENTNLVESSRQNMQSFYTQGQTPSGNSLWYKDLGFGLMVNIEWFFVSAQVDNVLRHKDNIYENDENNPRRSDLYYSFTAGTDWVSQNKKMSFSPYIVYQKNENLSEAWVGANYRINWLKIGAGVSSLMDPTASLGVRFKHFSLQYTADYLSSDMTHRRALSHQITLRIVGQPNRFGKRTLNL